MLKLFITLLFALAGYFGFAQNKKIEFTDEKGLMPAQPCGYSQVVSTPLSGTPLYSCPHEPTENENPSHDLFCFTCLRAMPPPANALSYFGDNNFPPNCDFFDNSAYHSK